MLKIVSLITAVILCFSSLAQNADYDEIGGGNLNTITKAVPFS